MATDTAIPLKYPRIAFFLLVRLAVLVLLGLNTRKREALPDQGPAIVAANHNSHLDTLVLISLFPLSKLSKIRPVAAADYFMENRLLAWFATRIVGVIPIARGKASRAYDPLKPCDDALDRGEVIILFPEGTRGEAEQISHFKKGIAYLAERHPHVPVTPVFLHGLGKALPKGDFVLVPFFCDIFVGEPMSFHGDKNTFMNALNERFLALASQGSFAVWD